MPTQRRSSQANASWIRRMTCSADAKLYHNEHAANVTAKGAYVASSNRRYAVDSHVHHLRRF